MKKGSTLIINGDNDMLATLRNDDYELMRFGIDGDNLAMRAINIRPDATGSYFIAVYGDESTEVFVPSVGIHNVYNALCAMCVGVKLGYTLAEASSGIADFEPEGMRQKITKINGITFIEDCYNANLDSMKASLDALATINKGKAYAVLGDMLELGADSPALHRSVGAYLAKKKIDRLYTLGGGGDQIAVGARQNGMPKAAVTQIHNVKALREMATLLAEELCDGDVVLFKASRSVGAEGIIAYLKELI
jgi:UDP-N-acetylmuramoyl-tripeptide--D-alanyl-D-alanine ligase